MPQKRGKLLARLKFERAQLIRPQDCIISSKARELGNVYGFHPTYYDEMVSFPQILSGEYGRKWFNEREAFLTDSQAKKELSDIDTKMKRRFVQRMMNYKKNKPKSFPIIHLKRFQNIPAKVDDKRPDDELRKICAPKVYQLDYNQRYKINCKGY